MSAAADSGAYTHKRPHLTSSEFDLDLELGLTRDVYDYETQEPAIASPRQPLSDDDFEDDSSFFNDALPNDGPTQHSYPSPDAFRNQFFPYLAPEAKSATQSVAYGSADGPEFDVDWRNGHLHELGLIPTPSPSQRTGESERNSHLSVDDKGSDSGLGPSIGSSTLSSAASKERHADAVAQESPGLGDRLARAQEHVPHTTNRFPDQARPYAFGNRISEQQTLHDEVGDMAAVVAAADRGQVAPPRFPCTFGGCRVIRDTKSALSHHERIHDEVWKRKHLCLQCGQGFPYPKDLRHHEDAHNGVRYACACGKTYARSDGRLRHLRDKGHTAA